MEVPLPPTTGPCTRQPKCERSATTLRITTAGITRRHSCSSPQRSRRCLTLSRLSSGSRQRSPATPRRLAESSAKPRRHPPRARISGCALERHGGPERLPHRGAVGGAPGAASSACGPVPWLSDLQAAIRAAVSDRNDRGPALADNRCCGARCGRSRGGILAHVRQRQLGGLPALDADHRPRRARRGRRRLEPPAKPFRPHARPWRG